MKCLKMLEFWWTHQDLNLGPLACEASALTGLSYASTANRIIAPSLLARKSIAAAMTLETASQSRWQMIGGGKNRDFGGLPGFVSDGAGCPLSSTGREDGRRRQNPDRIGPSLRNLGGALAAPPEPAKNAFSLVGGFEFFERIGIHQLRADRLERQMSRSGGDGPAAVRRANEFRQGHLLFREFVSFSQVDWRIYNDTAHCARPPGTTVSLTT